jgi:hypothetical protein
VPSHSLLGLWLLPTFVTGDRPVTIQAQLRLMKTIILDDVARCD